MDVTIHHDNHLYGRFHTSLCGRHNLQNLLAAIAVTHHLGLAPDQITAGLSTYAHIKRRCEVRGTVDGVIVIDDFAHHPTAVQMTLEGVRMLYPTQRLWAVFEPRTATSRRNIFQQDYERALQVADHVLIADVHRKVQLQPEERLSPDALVQGLRARDRDAWFYASTEAIITHLCRETRSSDVIIIMSNGGFENIHDRLMTALTQRSTASSVHPCPVAAMPPVCPETEDMV
jgi:UDP-N-acetylmuramate: L-alanyl-gamma-D-glutamyl-meso-diaminopimelate ligase